MARTEKAIFAGGCFWCVEAVFKMLKGVSKVRSGYIGGPKPNPTYQEVCTGRTGHAEAVEITFDPDVVSYDTLLDVFFVTHDPTQLNRQGNDVGTQYRSAVFVLDAAQKEAAEKARERANGIWDGRVVTEISDASPFYEAETYHQDYFAENPYQPYCMAVVQPKVVKARAKFRHLLVPEAAAVRD
jgi:peptide-methionine (S)-S-oxide reductase